MHKYEKELVHALTQFEKAWIEEGFEDEIADYMFKLTHKLIEELENGNKYMACEAYQAHLVIDHRFISQPGYEERRNDELLYWGWEIVYAHEKCLHVIMEGWSGFYTVRHFNETVVKTGIETTYHKSHAVIPVQKGDKITSYRPGIGTKEIEIV